METFSALLAICTENSPVNGEFPAQWPVTQSFDVFFYLRLNKRLSKQLWGWWSETPSRPLWRHCNVWHIPSTGPPFYQTGSTSLIAKDLLEKWYALYIFTAVTFFLLRAPRHYKIVRNSWSKTAQRGVIMYWSLIHGSNWSLMKDDTKCHVYNFIIFDIIIIVVIDMIITIMMILL